MSATKLPNATVVATTVQTGMFEHRWTPDYKDAPIVDVAWTVTPKGRDAITGNHGIGVSGQLPVMPDAGLAQEPGSYTVAWKLTRADQTTETYSQKVTVRDEHPGGGS